jgi:hypothetical protein
MSIKYRKFNGAAYFMLSSSVTKVEAEMENKKQTADEQLLKHRKKI